MPIFVGFGRDGVPEDLDFRAEGFCMGGEICVFVSRGVCVAFRGGLAGVVMMGLEVGGGEDARG